MQVIATLSYQGAILSLYKSNADVRRYLIDLAKQHQEGTTFLEMVDGFRAYFAQFPEVPAPPKSVNTTIAHVLTDLGLNENRKRRVVRKKSIAPALTIPADVLRQEFQSFLRTLPAGDLRRLLMDKTETQTSPLICKVTKGSVIQIWDTARGCWAGQVFDAGDDVSWLDNERKTSVAPAVDEEGEEPYLSFEMVQPAGGDK
jgi:hypothetical protein